MSFLKKLAKGIKAGAKQALSGAAQVGAGAGSQVTNTVRSGANILSGVATGNTDKIESNISRYGKDTVQNYRAEVAGYAKIGSGALQATTDAAGGALNLMGLNPALPKISSQGGFLGDTRNAVQIQKATDVALAQSEKGKLDAEESARPEKERQSLLNTQYQNSLLKSGKRGYNTLLGGGY